jgi:GNAT superfamily N-acetyltransferase
MPGLAGLRFLDQHVLHVGPVTELGAGAERRALRRQHDGAAGRVVVEEYLDGPEVSIFAITDGVTFSSLMDIYIERQYRNQGLGTRLINTMLAHPAIKPTICILSTQDAFLYYEKFNFLSCGTVLKRDPVT